MHIISGHAQNPIIQSMYTADPAPMVIRDTLFLYVGHDEDDAPSKSYLMREYRLFTTTDMVNWTDHGAPLKTSQISWSVNDASAAQVIERNGKYYWYFSTMDRNAPGGVSVGVAVSNSPYGPFKDALGKALITNSMTKYASHSWDDLDPTVFIDDDGQAYLFWGNGACYWVKLNKDMISIDGEIQHLEIKDKTAFAGKFTEAPWVYKRNKQYYLVYASEFPENISYSTSKSILGPWKAQGVLMPTERGSNTNHAGIVDYKKNSYFFYHNDALPGGHSYDRSVAVEQFSYNADGTIPKLKMTEAGIVKGVGTLNPYKRTEAETIAFSKGIKVVEDKERGVIVTAIHNGDYIKVRDVDFGKKGPSSFKASAASRYNGGNIEIYTDGLDGKLIGTVKVSYTGEWGNWKEFSINIENVNGVHDVYFVFKGKEPHTLFNFDYWEFIK
ncbi:carbohydrate-binding protein [Flavobacterium seoulense]|uniref:Carbohydrate-binding protein n=1 Tax=Flavobacterium seoulense TaxID=1492738 RepID=A0A066WSN0_9FLAO|nr:carbohydrate-binding protein [Flavobacterium seoulense]